MSPSDEPPFPLELAQQDAWLRGLLRARSRDASLAEDLAQETWLAALLAGALQAGGSGTKGWLARVAGRLAVTRLRREGRAGFAPLEGDERSLEAGVAQACLELEQRRALLAAVLALEPRDRRVVILRFYEGLAPREIAVHLGTSANAVRTRLSRALDRLRAALGGEQASQRWLGARLAWLSPSLPGSAGSSPVRAGALWLTGKWVLATLGAALAVVLAILPRNSVRMGQGSGTALVSPLAREAGPEQERELATATAEEPAAERSRAEGRPPAEPTAPVEGTTTLELQARIVDEEGRPIEAALFTAAELEPAAAVRSDARGEARLVLQRAALAGLTRIVVAAHAPGHVRRSKSVRLSSPGEASSAFVGELVLGPGGEFEGGVVDREGRPLEGIEVRAVHALDALTPAQQDWLRVWGGEGYVIEAELSPRARSDARGRYLLEGVPTGFVGVVAFQPGLRGDLIPSVAVHAGQRVELAELRLDALPVEECIRGHVLAPDGMPLAGARLQLLLSDGDALYPCHERSDASGSFRIPAARELSYRLRAVDERKRWPAAELLEVRAGSAELELRFEQPQRIELLVREAEAVVVGAAASAIDEHGSWLRSARESAAGLLELEAPDRPFSVVVQGPLHRARRLGPFTRETAPQRLEVLLERASGLRGRVLAGGVGVRGAHVHMHAPPQGGELGALDQDLVTRVDPSSLGAGVTNAAGEFFLPVFVAGSYLVHAESESHARASSAWIECSAEADVAGIEIELLPPGAVEGRVLTAVGMEARGLLLGFTNGDGHLATARSGEEGRYRLEGLAAGPWQVRRVEEAKVELLRDGRSFFYSGSAEPRADFVIVPGETAQHDLDLRGEEACVLHGRLALAGQAPPGWTAYLLGQRAALDASGELRLRVTPPGKALLFLSGPYVTQGQVHLQVPLELASGRNEWSLDLEVAPLALAHLPEAAPLREAERRSGMQQFDYGLEGEAGGARWRIDLRATPTGSIELEQVPCGSLRLRQRGPDSFLEEPERWPVIATLEHLPGARTTLDLGKH